MAKSNKKVEDTKVPESAQVEGRGEVGEKVTSSFDERTSVALPFVKADGSQDNGLADLSDADGARRETAREGNNTTVEDTEVAIENGDVIGNQSAGSKESKEAPKNPVATESDTSK